ncbi:MAG: hypothetical protein RLZZ70_467 [Candidatus Parcubacteria bacterium]|jgi:hypothetical protein
MVAKHGTILIRKERTIVARRDREKMDGITRFEPAINVSGPITLELLTQLTLRVLDTYFKGDYVEMLRNYADFCCMRETKADLHTHFEWACSLLNIKIEKNITL